MLKNERAQIVERTMTDAIEEFLLNVDGMVNTLKAIAVKMNIDGPLNSYIIAKDRLLLAVKDCLHDLDEDLDNDKDHAEDVEEDARKEIHHLRYVLQEKEDELEKMQNRDTLIKEIKELIIKLSHM